MLQGCPLSGSLFVICLNPFLHLLDKFLYAPEGPPVGDFCQKDIGEIARAFADDLALVLAGLQKLPKIASLFKILQQVSGLSLKASKCVLIPLGEVFDSNLIAKVRQFLHDNLPAWSSFRVESYGEYLGVLVGPGATPQLGTNRQKSGVVGQLLLPVLSYLLLWALPNII